MSSLIIINKTSFSVNENKSINKLFHQSELLIEDDFNEINKKVSSEKYGLIIFVTYDLSFPVTWDFEQLQTDSSILLLANASTTEILVFISYLSQSGLTRFWNKTLPSIIIDSLIYIEKNLHNNTLSNEEVAAFCHLSTNHFSRLFKDYIGMGYKEYLINKRIEKAKLLLSTGKKVKEVAKAVGYKSETHFSKIFIRKVGTHPSKYQVNINNLLEDKNSGE
ncbi:helix-turn-helix domain-containing protein [Cytobacillus pseudoceanisediminis]|uniref:helix-turn-helix domain-containing protein n=1 Tax=Cytobacillus pseudoceanisediminis TaxID=3051614 RepID=UPI003C2D44A8